MCVGSNRHWYDTVPAVSPRGCLLTSETQSSSVKKAKVPVWQGRGEVWVR